MPYPHPHQKKKKNEIEMYSTNNEGKSVIAERFIRTLMKFYYIKNLYEIWNLYLNEIIWNHFDHWHFAQKICGCIRLYVALKGNNDSLNRKATIILLTTGLIKNTLYKRVKIFQNWNLCRFKKFNRLIHHIC